MISHSDIDPVVLTVPSFLAKLWDMVNKDSINSTISWTKEGTSFVIKDKETFAFQVLPTYFKHCNLSSFIRQLNKYGFKKIQSIKNKNELEFAHDYFSRDDPEMLMKIKSKETESKISEKMDSEDILLNDLYQKVQSMKKTQDKFESKLGLIEDKSHELWNETIQLKRKQRIQQQIINNIMRFLVNVISQNEKDNNISWSFSKSHANKNKNLFAITEKPHSAEVNPFAQGNPIDVRDEGKLIRELMTSLIDTNGTEIYDSLSPSSISSILSESEKLDSDINTSGTVCSSDSVFSNISDMSSVLNMADIQLSKGPAIETGKLAEVSVLGPETNNQIILETNKCDNVTPNDGMCVENDLLLNCNDEIILEAPDRFKDFEIPVNEVEIEDQNLSDLTVCTSISDKNPLTTPNRSGNDELGDHINLMESNLNTLKELLSDTDLNLDMNEVDKLFLSEEMASLITDQNDLGNSIPLEDFNIKSLSNNDSTLCSDNPDSFSSKEDQDSEIYQDCFEICPTNPIIILPADGTLAENSL